MKSDSEKLLMDLKEREKTLRKWHNFLKLLDEKGKTLLEKGESEDLTLAKGFLYLFSQATNQAMSEDLENLEKKIGEVKELGWITVIALIGLQLITIGILLFRHPSGETNFPLPCKPTVVDGQKYLYCVVDGKVVYLGNGKKWNQYRPKNMLIPIQ